MLALHVVAVVVFEVGAVEVAVVEVVHLLLLYDFTILVLVKEFLGQLDGNGVELGQHFFHYLHDFFLDLVHHLIVLQHQLLVQ